MIPLILMFCINLFAIVKKLQISPLRFLRHDLTRTRRTKAMRLPRWSFLRRFRLRILFQNMPNYLVLLAASLIYLLAKIIIERNEHSISMSKILGFLNGEIGSLYIVPTAMIVILFSIVGFVAGLYLMIWVFKAFIRQMDGYFAFYMTGRSMVMSVVYLLVGYMFVSLIDYYRIRRITLDVALKNME